MISVVLSAGSVLVADETKRVPQRGEIATKDQWATENIFATVD